MQSTDKNTLSATVRLMSKMESAVEAHKLSGGSRIEAVRKAMNIAIEDLEGELCISRVDAARLANYLSAWTVLQAYARNPELDKSVEAVQIEWISNGILVRGKDQNGAFCNYYRDTSTFISQSLGAQTFEFVKGKEPKTGDKCIVYFGIADADNE